MPAKPIVFLAFANDRERRARYLRNLPEEARQLRAGLAEAERAGLCELVVRQNVTREELFGVFQDAAGRDRVAMFHYGGHADGYALLLEDVAGHPERAHAAGLAELLQASAAVGAFLVGIALSGPAERGAREVLPPLRDLFAALFFAFFGLQIDPSDLPGALAPAAALAVLTALTKVGTGWWSARAAGVGRPGRLRAGAVLTPRGEFSIVIAGIAVAQGVHPDLGAVAAAYVLMLAIGGPLLARLADSLAPRLATASS